MPTPLHTIVSIRALIEQYGTGIGRMFDFCHYASLSVPEMANFSGGFSILFMVNNLNTPHDAPHDGSTVSGQVMALLKACAGEMGRDALLGVLKLKDRKHFREIYLKPAIILQTAVDV